jgi:type II restriction/modification system DNA methylase subunit YeeA
VRPEADLCCYWFEKARAMIESGRAKRAGLLATQGIRGGANRDVLNRIKQTGDVFFAVSDRDWVLDGAAVHISMVGFDDGSDTSRVLDGKPVTTINPNLTSTADITQAQRLAANLGIGFMGDTKGGPFDVPFETARKFLDTPNVNGRPSSDVVTPWCNGLDVTRRNRDMWIIDFGTDMPEDRARLYEAPFAHVQTHVYPERAKNKRESYRLKWWIHVEARSGMRAQLAPLERFVAVARVAKHLLFVWMKAPTLPDSQIIVFSRSDDFGFGVLHSRVHEVWARSQGTQVRERESGFRYTPTTCFETFPFPEPTDAHRDAIASAAKELDALRSNWLNPPEWTRTKVLEFPGSADGPWKRYVQDVDPKRGIGTVRYPRTVPKDAAAAAKLKTRTLTNLYNESPAWLTAAHRKLDEAVFAAYGWPADLPDDELLAKLLELNLSRAGTESADAAEDDEE